ncbi:MAG: response regulator [candidate division Zixibacteria bacterium]|nr:response regulator [candidate division Zixibacteria bacterium]NIR64904.1 response regulator [candidate division Zixibacteria bacterium]NIS17709.1 response regulator [candidate division Zixibacteria bacterium]NIS46710.1 response regulator [candidate division Zixibacteria bacterium]NIT54025.1 response regulator [candidate division Zixibacteria bacterium]
MAETKVLLVDDEVEFTKTLSERLESRGLKVDSANSGEEAIKKIGESSYDAIFLDLAMPGMDGIETLKGLLAENPDLQVILLTGHASINKSVEAVKLGAKDFLEKPANIDKLLAKIKEASTERMLIVEKRSEDEIKKILKSKGW